MGKKPMQLVREMLTDRRLAGPASKLTSSAPSSKIWED